jgi:hypothetical protein
MTERRAQVHHQFRAAASAAHGVLRLVLELDGEIIGLLHRDTENQFWTSGKFWTRNLRSPELEFNRCCVTLPCSGADGLALLELLGIGRERAILTEQSSELPLPALTDLPELVGFFSYSRRPR